MCSTCFQAIYVLISMHIKFIKKKMKKTKHKHGERWKCDSFEWYSKYLNETTHDRIYPKKNRVCIFCLQNHWKRKSSGFFFIFSFFYEWTHMVYLNWLRTHVDSFFFCDRFIIEFFGRLLSAIYFLYPTSMQCTWMTCILDASGLKCIFSYIYLFFFFHHRIILSMQMFPKCRRKHLSLELSQKLIYSPMHLCVWFTFEPKWRMWSQYERFFHPTILPSFVFYFTTRAEQSM